MDADEVRLESTPGLVPLDVDVFRRCEPDGRVDIDAPLLPFTSLTMLSLSMGPSLGGQ
jgi:hypothetical protein